MVRSPGVGSPRRLAAIMFTDIVGSAASAQADERAALQRLRELEDIVRPLFTEFQGREVKSTGDGFLVEFSSTLQAARCGIEINRRLHERNSRSDTLPLELRIGIHLGDVEQSGEDILGDAVNIASRIESLANPGGICVSQQVYDQVRNKLDHPIVSIGRIGLKNIDLPTEVYAVSLPWVPFPSPNDVMMSEGLTQEASSHTRSLVKSYLARANERTGRHYPKLITKLAMRNGIVDVELLNAPEIPPALGKFSGEVDYGRTDTFRVISGAETVKVIIDSKNLAKLLALIPKKNVMKVIGNLAEIVVSETEEILETPGVVAMMTNELFESGVNMREFMTCSPASIIVVDERDAWKAYEALKRFQ